MVASRRSNSAPLRSIEDPFQGSIRLSIICDNIRREVLLESENGLRYTAFDDCPIENENDDPSLVMNAMNSEDSQQHILMDDASGDGNNAGDYAYAPVQ